MYEQMADDLSDHHHWVGDVSTSVGNRSIFHHAKHYLHCRDDENQSIWADYDGRCRRIVERKRSKECRCAVDRRIDITFRRFIVRVHSLRRRHIQASYIVS